MEDKKLEDMSLKDLTARLEAITKERAEIVALIQDAASKAGVVATEAAAPGTPRTLRAPRAAKAPEVKAMAVPRSGGTTADKVKAALSGGKVLPTGDLVAALVAEGCNKGTATQFLYGKVAKKMLKKTDAGWTLKG
jgi:hypothetical protein